ncbi:MAG: AAC(3) family N-acetyltransferase [Ruminococcaceae bacterium]|nr:AAC(3) family N-acetyltransferase [Oscillospiraceae bacterium]
MFSKDQIIKQLTEMNAPRDGIVMMHSSMRCVGEVEGGGEGFLDALIEYFTEKGGLFCIPTPTARNYFHHKEFSLDMASTENDLGILSTIALQKGTGVRSENPVLSIVVFGDKEKAKKFVEDDAKIKTPTAKESCYGKLASQNGFVLLVGIGQEKNTFLHSVAELLDLPDRMESESHPVKVRRSNGEVVNREVKMYQCSKTVDVSQRFPKYETAFRYHGCIKDGFLGNAPVQLCDAKKMKDTVALIFENSGGKDPLETERFIPPSWFCNKK